MSIGIFLLIASAILVLFGVAQRVLDRLRLTDRQAILFAALILLGGLLPNVRVTDLFSFNVGGALVPLGLCLYLLIGANRAYERLRALLCAVIAMSAVFLLGRMMPSEPADMAMDPNYLYGIVAGLIAALFGGSRRGAFIAGVLGVLGADGLQALMNYRHGIMQPLVLGGAGAFDAVVISGLLAVIVSELCGEIMERFTRGSMERGEQRR